MRHRRRPCACALCACDKRTVKLICDFCEVGLHRESIGGMLVVRQAPKTASSAPAQIICPLCAKGYASPILAASHADRHSRGEI